MKTWKLIVLMLCCSMIGVCGKYLYDYIAQSAENLQQFVSLEEQASTAIVEESTKAIPSGKEGKAATQTKPAKATPVDEAPKKSIHARLQEKKKEIAKKPGKDILQKGVELA